MSDVSQWNIAAASNNSAAPDGAPEGMAPSAVNDVIREIMAALARWYSDFDGTLTSAGSSNAYTLTTNSTHAALADMPVVAFRVDRANTGAATLNVDSLGAKSMQMYGRALVADDLVADTVVLAVYNATADAYDLIGATQESAGTFTGTLTGMTASTTGTVRYVKMGQTVTLWLTNDISGTSNTTAMTMTGLPDAVMPGAAKRLPCFVMDASSGGSYKLGSARVLNLLGGSNTIHFGVGETADEAGFTASGTKGLRQGWSLTYTLDDF